MRIKGRASEIKVISILIIICGVVLLILGIQGIDRAFFGIWLTDIIGFEDRPPIEAEDLVILTVYSIFTALGIGYLLMYSGLLKGKKWEWNITRILVSFGIVIGIISLIFELIFAFTVSEAEIPISSFVSKKTGNVIVVALSAIILYFLYRPNVRTGQPN